MWLTTIDGVDHEGVGVRAADYAYFSGAFIAMAHRGGPKLPANEGRENTLWAFRNAVALGYRHLETDVHLTRDGAVVAFHDTDLSRVTGRKGGLAAHSLAELREVTVGGEPIPLLSELLEALPEAMFNIDIKADGAEEPLAQLLNWHQATARVCVGSFSNRRIRQFRRLAGRRVATSCSPLATAWLARETGLNRVVDPAGQVLQIPEFHQVAGRRVRLVSPALIARAHRLGKQVHVWTIDDENDMHRLIDWGVDGLITDAIDVLKRVTESRGLWQAA